jgi:fructose-1,6-bisphosphatase/inositol monophosphatase family enzyme
MAIPGGSDLLALARPVAEAAGRRLVEAPWQQRSSILTKSSVTDLVTEMDRSVEEFIVGSILAARPDDAIEGEEAPKQAGTSGVRWYIDPIDGTVNYVHGLAGFSVSVAAECDGEMTAAVVVSPMHDEVFTATSGGGAFCNDVPIRCSDRTALSTALIGTGFSYRADRRTSQAQVLTTVLSEVADIRRVGSAALDLCWTASGRLDGYYEAGLGSWDYAAGALIAREAGAALGDLSGGSASGAFLLAAPPPLFEPLRALLTRAGAVPFA